MKNLNGKSVKEGIEFADGGAISFTGDGISFYRLLLLRQGLAMQVSGMRMTARGPAASTIARRELGIKGKTPSLLAQVEEIIERIKSEAGQS